MTRALVIAEQEFIAGATKQKERNVERGGRIGSGGFGYVFRATCDGVRPAHPLSCPHFSADQVRPAAALMVSSRRRQYPMMCLACINVCTCILFAVCCVTCTSTS